MHINTDLLGSIIKESRESEGRTVESLANSLGISERYLYRIENEGKKPSYDILYKIIRELNISPVKIFFPEKPCEDSEVERLLRLISNCDKESIDVIIATAKALIKVATQKKN